MRFLFQFLSQWLWSYAFSRLPRIPFFIWVFIAVFLVTTAFTVKFYSLKLYGARAEGVVVGSSSAAAETGGAAGPKWVKFVAEDGKERYDKIIIPVFYSLGSKISVFYEKRNPETHYADTYWNSWGLFAIGAALLSLSIAMWMASPRRAGAQSVDSYSGKKDVSEDLPHRDGCITRILKVLSVIFMLIAVSDTFKYHSLNWSGVKAKAVVVTTQMPDLSEPRPKGQKVLFLPGTQEKPVFFHSIKLDDYKIGHEIEVLYDPDNTQRVVPDNPAYAYGYLIIAIFFMAYAWGPGILLRLFYRIRRKYS